METPRDLKFTQTHEWVRLEGDNKITVGITDFAQEQLSDLTYVELPSVGDSFGANEDVAVVESVKAASDIYAPVNGTITEVNSALLDNPEIINGDPYEGGWLFRMEVENPADLEQLLDIDQYEESMPDNE